MKPEASVLVVDDNLDLLDTFGLILKRKGYQVDLAADGAAALDKVRERSFDIVLMDILMPRMNGIEALRRMRDINPDLKVIMMTAYSDEQQMESAVSDGAYCTLRKPISIAGLIEIMGEAVARPLVLVVDDDGDFGQTLARTLELKGYPVAAARSGEEALDIARDRGCGIALLDLRMPLMDGVETYLKLREINANLAAVMMTGYREEAGELLDRASPDSALACLYKPFDPGQALALISELSKRHNGGKGARTRDHIIS